MPTQPETLDSAPLPNSDYSAFLLRIWQSSGDDKWLASLENIYTGQQQQFNELAALLKHVQTFHNSQVKQE